METKAAGATITLSSDADPNDDLIARLMKAVQDVIPIDSEISQVSDDDLDFYEESPVIQLQANGRPNSPRRVDEMQDFGSQLAAKSSDDAGLLFGDELLDDDRGDFSRQNDDGSDSDLAGPAAEAAAAGDNEIRCVPKVMQVSLKHSFITRVRLCFCRI